MTFSGWPEEALDFYDGLEADNSRTYWLAHKQAYETCVREPMLALLAELEPEHGESRIFRPYRDVRFSKDKSPYKTAVGAIIGGGYIQLSAKGLAVGNGMYSMAADQLERYRRAVAADISGAGLERLVASIRSQGIDVHGHEMLKSAPRGYQADHPRIDLLRCKGLVAWQEWPARAWLGTAGAKSRVTAFLAATAPMSAWLGQHVGESELPRR
jgi:uncharacterized protein (TIGR02453 family)